MSAARNMRLSQQIYKTGDDAGRTLAGMQGLGLRGFSANTLPPELEVLTCVGPKSLDGVN